MKLIALIVGVSFTFAAQSFAGTPENFPGPGVLKEAQAKSGALFEGIANVLPTQVPLRAGYESSCDPGENDHIECTVVDIYPGAGWSVGIIVTWNARLAIEDGPDSKRIVLELETIQFIAH